MSKVWLDKDFLRVRTRQRTVQDCTVQTNQDTFKWKLEGGKDKGGYVEYWSLIFHRDSFFTNLVNTKSETKRFNKSLAININRQKSLSYLEYSIDSSGRPGEKQILSWWILSLLFAILPYLIITRLPHQNNNS